MTTAEEELERFMVHECGLGQTAHARLETLFRRKLLGSIELGKVIVRLEDITLIKQRDDYCRDPRNHPEVDIRAIEVRLRSGAGHIYPDENGEIYEKLKRAMGAA